MNLVVDCGNTTTKVAVFEKEELLYSEHWRYPSIEKLDALFREYTLRQAIVCTVVKLEPALVQHIKAHIPYVVLLNAQTPVPLQNGYKTPESLGMDRLAVAVGAHYLQPNKPLLIIDLGTAITYDFVSQDAVFLGGNIAPGTSMRLHSLHHYTQQLPDVPKQAAEQLLGNDTTSAIVAGVMKGIEFEIDGYVAELRYQYPELFVFLTGGDAFFFEKKLKSSIFVSPNLLLIGLNQILNYNACLQKGL